MTHNDKFILHILNSFCLPVLVFSISLYTCTFVSFQLINDAFHITEVPLNKQDELYRSEDIHIMVFKKR